MARAKAGENSMKANAGSKSDGGVLYRRVKKGDTYTYIKTTNYWRGDNLKRNTKVTERFSGPVKKKK